MRWKRSSVAVGLTLLLAPCALEAAIRGRVETPQGESVEGARVVLLATEEAVVTDRRGDFVFPLAEPPARLRIEHPRFVSQEHEIPALPPGDDPMILILSPKHLVYEEIVVSATFGTDGGYRPASVAASVVSVEDAPTVPPNVVGLLTGTPGVAENGQGGHFQTYSVRGIAGARVMTLFDGVRIVTERRAGASASFVDPLLLERAEVVRGPFSSYYGSGALGGLVQIFARRYDQAVAEVGYDSQGNGSFVALGAGWRGWSLGLAYRRADDAETPDGTPLFSRFRQGSATLTRRWSLGSHAELDLLVAPAIGRDIGKPNRRYPQRVTLYPEENHLLSRLTLSTDNRWRFDLWAHPNELYTENSQASEESLVENLAFDFGLRAQRELDLAGGFDARLGIDYFGRRGVEAKETVEDRTSGDREVSLTLDGDQDEIGLFGALHRSFGRVMVEAGGRATWLRQDNRGAEATTDTALTFFAGMTAPLGRGFEWVANLGSGFRFPGLSERFYSGSTGRGEVVANEGLAPETSRNVDLGLRYFGRRLHIAVYAFRNQIEDYIERVEVSPGVRSYVNLTAGTIEGFELDGFFQVSETLRISWAGQRSRGEDEAHRPLSDIAQDRLQLGGEWSRGAWSLEGRLQHRFDKDEIGAAEQRIDAADLLSASLRYRIDESLALRLSGTNLLDESYLPAADELAVPAPGRSLGLSLSWGR